MVLIYNIRQTYFEKTSPRQFLLSRYFLLFKKQKSGISLNRPQKIKTPNSKHEVNGHCGFGCNSGIFFLT